MQIIIYDFATLHPHILRSSSQVHISKNTIKLDPSHSLFLWAQKAIQTIGAYYSPLKAKLFVTPQKQNKSYRN